VAKIAVQLREAVQARRRSGGEGGATARLLAGGEGWSVKDVLCTSGPDDRPFEEQHAMLSVSVVAAGTFQYRAAKHAQLMSPGSLLLGQAGRSFECAHEHGWGDRCIAFFFAPDWFERVTGSAPRFTGHRIPPLRASAPLVAGACAALEGGNASWEELAVSIAVRAAALANGAEPPPLPSIAVARVTRAVRIIERYADAALSLHRLAEDARLSSYHFLRTFTRVAGVTPHQFALRARLRNAALCLAADEARVLDVALDCGFGDVSNFTRTFRAEFGVAPGAYRAASSRPRAGARKAGQVLLPAASRPRSATIRA
jgi:AraC-like DNA-binding protein